MILFTKCHSVLGSFIICVNAQCILIFSRMSYGKGFMHPITCDMHQHCTKKLTGSWIWSQDIRFHCPPLYHMCYLITWLVILTDLAISFCLSRKVVNEFANCWIICHVEVQRQLSLIFQLYILLRDDVEPKENFMRNWEDYKVGFGDFDREFWLGKYLKINVS